jgi:hypothetical protein
MAQAQVGKRRVVDGPSLDFGPLVALPMFDNLHLEEPSLFPYAT